MPKLYLIVFRADMKSYVSQYEWQGHRTGTSRSDNLNIAPERLAESVWCSKSHSSLLNINFRLSGIQTSLLLIYFRYCPTTSSHCDEEWKKPIWYLTIQSRWSVEINLDRNRAEIKFVWKEALCSINFGSAQKLSGTQPQRAKRMP